jgi:hypothetical protein
MGADFWEILERGSADILNIYGKVIDLQQKEQYGRLLNTQTSYLQNVAGQTVNYNLIIIVVLLLVGAFVFFKK